MDKNRLYLRKVVAIAICLTGMTVFSSCEKDVDRDENFYCTNTIKSSPTITTLSKSEMDVIKYLFNRNQLDYTKYQFTRFQKDELGYHHIRCFQFANNLMVFTSDAIFHFDKNDNYYYLSGDLITTINLNTKSSMKQDEVVEKFIDEIKRNGFYAESTEILTGCFDIEFGYYDLNAGISYTNEEFVKAWKIKSTNQDYPFAYINDENSEIIYYDNGIRF
jgi:Zn-dependent metalloprotease